MGWERQGTRREWQGTERKQIVFGLFLICLCYRTIVSRYICLFGCRDKSPLSPVRLILVNFLIAVQDFFALRENKYQVFLVPL